MTRSPTARVPQDPAFIVWRPNNMIPNDYKEGERRP